MTTHIDAKQPLCFETCFNCEELDNVTNIEYIWTLFEEAQKHQQDTGHITLVYTEKDL